VNRRRLIVATAWFAGATAYVALSFVLSRGLSILLMQLAGGSVSSYMKYNLSALHREVFVLCMFVGTLYVSALARPSTFGGTARIFKHLAGTYVLVLTGCFVWTLEVFVPYPNFQHKLALAAYPFVVICLSILSFLLALAVWIRLAFCVKPALPGGAQTIPNAAGRFR
jgi:uncharacterized membrane protein